MKNIMYRWYYEEEDKTSISGIVLTKDYDNAVKETKEYLEHQFGDINGEMNLIGVGETTNSKLVTLWIWEAAEDDDYNDDFPDCLAIAY